jgi:hypothetical protein
VTVGATILLRERCGDWLECLDGFLGLRFRKRTDERLLRRRVAPKRKNQDKNARTLVQQGPPAFGYSPTATISSTIHIEHVEYLEGAWRG